MTTPQQHITITGVVIDNHGEPVIGANIVQKGTVNGTVTDFDGNYSLQVPQGATLQISYIGYLSQEIVVGSNNVINITLQEDTHALEEVVVVGYGTLQKKQVTSSITSVSAADLPVGVGGSSIATALVGKVGGLIITGTDSPNSGNTLQLRGPSSINAGKDPLVVIDGMPGGDIRSVNQEDILSIDVLKDASAGAIYGTRATGGVILITTKQSNVDDGKVKLTYNGEVAFKQTYGKPRMLTADEYRRYEHGIDYGSNVDWWDESLTDNPTSQKHTVTLQTGTKNAQVYTSFFYENNRGVVKFDDRTDYGGRINGRFKLLDGWVEINTHADYRQAMRKQSKAGMAEALRNNPTRPVYDPDSQTGYNVWLNETLQNNSIADAALNTDEGMDKWFRPDVLMKVNILPVSGLSYTQTVAYELRQWEQHRFKSRYHRDEIQNNNRGGDARLNFDKTEFLNTEGYVTYVNAFGDHYINAVAGYSFHQKNGEKFEARNYDFSVDPVQFWNIGQGSYLKDGKADMSSSKNITEKLGAYFGRVNYSYKDRYMTTATFRREGSSKFAKNNRWGNFWSISGGWRISEENFMAGTRGWLNDLKVRAAYGVIGNNNFDADYAATLYGSDQVWLMPTGNWAYTYGKTRNVNTDLKWEETREWNFGLDFSVLNNRLYGKVDLYRQKVHDMIYEIEVSQPPYTQSSMHMNIGNMENKGWEVEIGADIIRTKDLTYSTSLNISGNTSKILSLWGNQSYFNKGGLPSPGNPGDALRVEEGVKLGSFYLWKYAGIDQTTGEFLLYNKDGEIIPASEKTMEDKQYIGNYYPKAILGWTHNVRYKNWDFGVVFTGWFKYDIYNTVEMYMGLPNVGDGLNVLQKAYKKNSHIKGEKQLCDYFLDDASFFKIQSINVGYNLNLKPYTNNLVDMCRLYLTINNVAKFTKYGGVNPEQNVTGFEHGIEYFGDIYPQTRQYTLGLQLTF
ncbi:MAG: SusC/RagA family TonB-linked outer membrane protein [Tannerellaceae bacterium]|nr:SusC/RagA family TonB-linked outer membrane protein [Tannerellaceae bacterium]